MLSSSAVSSGLVAPVIERLPKPVAALITSEVAAALYVEDATSACEDVCALDTKPNAPVTIACVDIERLSVLTIEPVKR